MNDMEKPLGKIAQRVAASRGDGEISAPIATMQMTAEQVAQIANQAVAAYVSAQSATARDKAAAEIAKVEGKIGAEVNQAPNINMLDRVWIILSDSKHISRGGGHFFGVNGATFLLKPGKKAYVPRALVNVLNDAIESIPITDDDGIIIEYRDVLRFPYQMVAAP